MARMKVLEREGFRGVLIDRKDYFLNITLYCHERSMRVPNFRSITLPQVSEISVVGFQPIIQSPIINKIL